MGEFKPGQVAVQLQHGDTLKKAGLLLCVVFLELIGDLLDDMGGEIQVLGLSEPGVSACALQYHQHLGAFERDGVRGLNLAEQRIRYQLRVPAQGREQGINADQILLAVL